MSFEPETTPRGPKLAIGGEGAAQARRARSALVEALSVYAEPLVARSRVLVIGEAGPEVWAHLLEMGAESVLVLDVEPARARRLAATAPRGVTVRSDPETAIDVREAAFDLAIVTDVARLADAETVVRRLRRVVDEGGAVVALGRASESGGAEAFADLGPAAYDYEGLYDLFALAFEHVTMTGVLPFRGIVFAELGGDEDVAVSVDTRLGPEGVAPSVFVVVASREPLALDPYAIVQTAPGEPRERDAAAEAAFAAMQLRAELLASQLEELRGRLAQAEASPRSARLLHETEGEIARLRESEHELTAALTRVALERDAALVKIVELEATASRYAEHASTLERRVLAAEQSMTDRARALAVAQEDLERIAGHHAAELLELEERLQERARTVAEHEREMGRREELVRDLVARLEELREAPQAAPEPLPAEPSPAPSADTSALEQKLDALALDVARRESEIVARGWKVRELETALSRAHGEIDALRQALAQEHAARTAAEAAAAKARADAAEDAPEHQGGG